MTQPSSDPLEILLAHDAWATRGLLEACRPLSREQFHREFAIGLGSLHETLTHIISVMRRWTDRLAVRHVRPALHAVKGHPEIAAEAADRTSDALIALLDQAARDLGVEAGRCRERGLETTISMQWTGSAGPKTYTFTRGAVLVHVATHGMHHRAQCLNMLRQLKVAGLSDKLPEFGVVDWQAQTEIAAVAVESLHERPV